MAKEGRAGNIRFFVAGKYGELCFCVEWKDSRQRLNRQQGEEFAATLIEISSQVFAEYIDRKAHLENVSLKDLFYSLGFYKGVKVHLPSSFGADAAKLLGGGNKMHFSGAKAYSVFRGRDKPFVFYPGVRSNPMHGDHVSNFEKCKEIYGGDFTFAEISVKTVGKPDLDSIEISRRHERIMPTTANLIFSNCMLFEEKLAYIKK